MTSRLEATIAKAAKTGSQVRRGRQPDADDVVGERPEEVPARRRPGAARRAEEARDAGEVVAQQADVGGLAGEVGARADGEAEVGRRERGGVVEPVPHEGDGAADLGAQRADRLHLRRGEEAAPRRVLLEADRGGHRADRGGRVAREDDDARPRGAERGDRRGGVGARAVLEDDGREHDAVRLHDDLGVAAGGARAAPDPRGAAHPHARRVRPGASSTSPSTPRPGITRTSRAGSGGPRGAARPRRSRGRARARSRPRRRRRARARAPGRRRARGGRPSRRAGPR